MTTFVYETIPAKTGNKVRYFEIKQSMSEPALTQHPETGEPIRRVMLGGLGVLKSGGSEPASGECGCGPGSCCG
jgi:predicted nucleic acid-binding Zn ribbon protein